MAVMQRNLINCLNISWRNQAGYTLFASQLPVKTLGVNRDDVTFFVDLLETSICQFDVFWIYLVNSFDSSSLKCFKAV